MGWPHASSLSGDILTNPQVALVDAFERAAGELPSDPAFSGVEIVEHKSRRHGASFELSLAIDRPGETVDVATCERVAGRINRELDAFSEPYTLAVTSAGLDRPLRQPADYERFRDAAVCLRTKMPLDGRKTHRGTLRGLRAETVVLDVGGSELHVPLESIDAANVEFDIRADLQRAKKERKDARKSR